MPAFPQSVYRVLQLTTDINCAPRDLVSVVEHDPVLTLHLLKLVNSPHFGLSREVLSIKQAVVYVGINTLKNLALRTVPLNVLPDPPLTGTPSDPLTNALLLHATSTAVIARRLARKMGVSEIGVADYFVAGLLHDFGQVVFACCQSKQFQRAVYYAEEKKVSLIRMEKHVFGWDHAELGAYLGEKWHLPKDLIACMRDHHTPNVQNPTLLHDCVYVANLLASKMDSGFFGGELRDEKLPESIVRHFGLTLPELRHAIGDISEEIGKMQVFF